MLPNRTFIPTKRIASATLAFMLVAAMAFGLGNIADAKTKVRKQQPQPEIGAIELAQRIHVLINKERARYRLTALTWDDALADVATKHSRDMAQRDYFAHVSPDGSDFAERYRRSRYHCEIRVDNTIYGGAENLALGRLYNKATIIDGVKYPKWNTMEQIARNTVDGWMHSAGHRHNILNPHWRQEGIGIVILPENKVLVTQNFC